MRNQALFISGTHNKCAAFVVVGLFAMLITSCDIEAQSAQQKQIPEQKPDLHTELKTAQEFPDIKLSTLDTAFNGFDVVEVPGSISGNLGGLGDAIVSVLDAVGYSQMTLQDGVSKTIAAETLENGNYYFDYVLSGLSDSNAPIRHLKVLFEKQVNGYHVVRIGENSQPLSDQQLNRQLGRPTPPEQSNQVSALVVDSIEPHMIETEPTNARVPKITPPASAVKPLPPLSPTPVLIITSTITPKLPAAPAPRATIMPTREHLVLQDGIDAFVSYRLERIPESLQGTYPNVSKAMAGFLVGMKLRELANEEDVSAWAKIRTNTSKETTFEYELTYLPDPIIYAKNYKVYFEQVGGGYQIARMGLKVKCYHGSTPKQWTVEPCP